MSRRRKPGARPRVLPVATKAPTSRPSEAALARGTAATGRARRMIPFVLVALGVAAYANSFGGVFLLDDVVRITDSPRIRDLWSPWQVVAGTTRPLLYLSLAANWN